MFVWSAAACFFFGYLMRAFRFWMVMRPYRLSFLAVVTSIVFSVAITVFTTIPWVGEFSKWLLLGVLFSSFLMGSFLTIIYTRLFDFFVLGLFFAIWGSGVHMILPWIAVCFAAALLLFAVLFGGALFSKRLSAFLLNRWYYLDSVKVIVPIINCKSSMEKLKLFKLKTLVMTFAFSVLIWIFEGLGFFYVLSRVDYLDIRQGVVQGLLSHITQLGAFLYSKEATSAVFIQQVRYESFEVPLFLIAVALGLFSMRVWAFPKKAVKNG